MSVWRDEPGCSPTRSTACAREATAVARSAAATFPRRDVEHSLASRHACLAKRWVSASMPGPRRQRLWHVVAGCESNSGCEAEASANAGLFSCQLPPLGLGLLEPVRHPHLAVHRRRGCEMLLRLLALARAPVEFAEAEVAVRDEGTHAKFGSERHRLMVVAFLCLGVGQI